MAFDITALKPSWLDGYERRSLFADLLAGLILSVLLVPQAMAYAQLAGLPPETGLYAALAPPLLYLLFGTSPYVSLGPVALVSLLVAEATGNGDIAPLDGAMIIAIEAGIILCLLGLFRLGRLVNFVSEPALLGFTAAAALLIATSQLPPLLGLDVARSGNLIGTATALLPVLGDTVVAALLIGGGALVLLLLADRHAAAGLWKAGIRPPWRQAIVKSVPLVIIIGAALAVQFAAPDVATVQKTEGGLPALTLPPIEPAIWLRLLPSAAVVAIIAFVIGTAVAKSLAGKERRSLDTSREALAIGAANIGAGLTGGYAVGVSLSRSALVCDSGARSPLASMVAALVVLTVLLFFADALSYLPQTALAALVISAVFGLVKTREIAAIWRYSKVEGAVFLATLLATLLLGVQWGLAVGALLGIAAFLWFSSVPRVTRVGSMDDGDSFRSIDREEVEVDTMPVLVVRIDRSIYFGNASYCENRILEEVARHPEATCLILDMRAVNTIDASGIAMLERLLDNLDAKDLSINFAAIHEPIWEALQANGQARLRSFYRTVAEAVEECGGRSETG